MDKFFLSFLFYYLLKVDMALKIIIRFDMNHY
jgi:hypothetical protein